MYKESKEKEAQDRLAVAASGRIKERDYWLAKLAGNLEKTTFPYDHTPVAQAGKSPGNVEFNFPGKMPPGLMKLINSSDYLLHIILTAALLILLRTYSKNNDIIVATPVWKQEKKARFINTVLALRLQLEDSLTFKEIIVQVKQTIIEAIENQNYPLELLLNQINIISSDKEPSLFDTAVLVENIQDKNYLRHVPLNTLFSFLRTGESLRGMVEYNPLLFEKKTIERIVSNFLHLLQGLVADIDTPIANIQVLSPEERKQVVLDFNSKGVDFPMEITFQQMFEAQVEKTASRLALVLKNSNLTYAELNRRANRLALTLRGRSVEANSIVAIMMDRSLEMILGILGILKAGGAYLPLDPEYPLERIVYMLENAEIKQLLTDKHIKDLLNLNLEMIEINDNCSYTGDQRNVKCINKATDWVYVIYTSGTTGKPKGVIIQHNNFVNAAFAWRQEYNLEELEINLLQMASFSFDVFAADMGRALINGGKLVICPDYMKSDLESLYQLIRKHRITIFDSIPSLMIPLMDYVYKNQLPEDNLKLLIVGSDRCPRESFRELTSRFGKKMRIINCYGVTEATIDTSYYEDSLENIPVRGNLPIGKPLPNQKFYVLNSSGNLCPIGAGGELYCGGKGVAAGYLNRVELTHERFLANPFVPNERIYKTGDAGRWHADGNMEFLGRLDDQVKVRGFRIELGEIENPLLNHEKIKAAAAVAIDRSGNNTKENEEKNLCAYIVAESELTVHELKTYLSGKLPSYMIPAYFVMLDQLPLTPNGKVNRNALPRPEGIDLAGEVEYTAPRNAIERKLVEVWESILGKTPIGIHENYFLIGGDSIKTIQIASRMNGAGYKVEVKDIFLYPCISELAARVTKLTRLADQSVITGSIHLTPIQKEFFLGHQIAPNHYNQAVVLYSKERLQEEAISVVFTKIQEHHDALRINFKRDEKGEIIQVNRGLPYPLALHVYDLRHTVLKNDLTAVIESKANQIQASIDLENGPLMQLGLFQLHDGDRLLIVIHHLVIDGVSWRVLLEDIDCLYNQYKKRKPLQLPLKTDSFKVWAGMLSGYANSEPFLKEKKYWKEVESKAVPPIERDFEEGSNLLKSRETQSFQLSRQETDQLLTVVNRAFGTEINDILLTALGMAARKIWGHDRVLIALEGHGRQEILEDVNINRTVGWFTCEYPVLLELSYDNDLSRQIREIKEILHRVPNKGIGHGILKHLTVSHHKKEINFKLKPQLSFNYLGQFDTGTRQMAFVIENQSVGNCQSLNEKGEYEINISGMIADKLLEISCTYSDKQYKPETVSAILTQFKVELEHIISFCSTRESNVLTPVDLTYEEMSIDTLDQLTQQYPLEDIYVLSPMQEGILFHAVYGGKSQVYFEQSSYRIQGELNIDVVEKSINEIFKRHDVLRTVFCHEGLDRPLQVVLKDWHVDILYEDLRKIGTADRKETFIEEFKENDRQRSFELSKELLMRFLLFRSDNDEYEFVWSSHHILIDGWSTGILISEFFEIYNSFLQNRTYQLPTAKPYRAYIEWLEKRDISEGLSHWQKYLGGYEQNAALSKFGKHKRNIEYKMEEYHFVIDEGLTKGLEDMAKKNKVTMNTVFQTLWGILLLKYNNSNDILFGTVVSGRPSEIEDIETMVGLFINTVPVRVRIEDKQLFSHLLKVNQRNSVLLKPYEYIPLVDILENSSLKSELVDHIITFQNFPIQEVVKTASKTGEALFTVEDMEVFAPNNFDLNVIVEPGKYLKVKFKYNSMHFEEGFLAGIAMHLEKIMGEILKNDKLKMSQIELMFQLEKEEIRSQLLDDLENE